MRVTSDRNNKPPSDFNDLHLLYGLAEVRRQLFEGYELWLARIDVKSEIQIPDEYEQWANVPAVQKMEVIEADSNAVQHRVSPAKTNNDWADFELTTDEIEGFMEPKFVVEDLIIQGHMSVFPAPPNAGKTTIFLAVAGDMSKAGYDVIYVNVDLAASDAKWMHEKSKCSGAEFRLLTPDLKEQQTADDIINRLKKQLTEGVDFTNQVWIFDTLKKFVDVINKGSSKRLYKLFRALTGKGMTIICLAHTNKYPGPDGKLVFEGTGDLRSDFDELIYLISQEDGVGGRKVSTDPDKVRGKFNPITFYIDSDRRVSLLDKYHDLAEEAAYNIQFAKDEDAIEAIKSALRGKKPKQLEILGHCKELGFSQRTTLKILKRYAGKLWVCENGFENNVKIYSIIK